MFAYFSEAKKPFIGLMTIIVRILLAIHEESLVMICNIEQGWRRFDLNSPSKKDSNVEMCKVVSFIT